MKGKAYALFNCNRTLDAIRKEFSSAQRIVELPNLELIAGLTKDFKGGPIISEVFKRFDYLDYFVGGSSFKLNHQDAADQLEEIFNIAQQGLFDDNSNAECRIVCWSPRLWLKDQFQGGKYSYRGYYSRE